MDVVVVPQYDALYCKVLTETKRNNNTGNMTVSNNSGAKQTNGDDA